MGVPRSPRPQRTRYSEKPFRVPQKIDREYYLRLVELDKREGRHVPPTCTAGRAQCDSDSRIPITPTTAVLLAVLKWRSLAARNVHACWADENDKDMFN